MSQEQFNVKKENLEDNLAKEYQKKINEWENKYSEINDDNKIDAAKDLADMLHDWTGVVRINSGKRYAEEHVGGVANLVGGDSKVVAYLHDTLEDTSRSYEENTGKDLRKLIAEKFGENVLRVVESLSEDKEKRGEKERELKLKDFDGDQEKTEKYFKNLKKGKDVKFENDELKSELKEYLLDLSIKNIKALRNELGEEFYKIAAEVRIADMIQNLADYSKQGEGLQKRNLRKAKEIYERFKDLDLKVLDILKNMIERIEG